MPRSLRSSRASSSVLAVVTNTISMPRIFLTLSYPLYGKIMNRTTRLKAHDEENACGVGDRVMVMETRPLSKDKRWRLTQIIEKAK